MNTGTITFVTGNANKAKHASRLLGYPVVNYDMDLPEIQSLDLREVVEAKLKSAYEILKKPLIVEDVSLEFCELKRLPGTFIKFFVKELGLDYLCGMLDKKDKTAIAKCMIGFTDGTDTHLFLGAQSGKITAEPRGDAGFGWDRIFVSDQFPGKTNAELDEVEYAKYFTAIRRFDSLKDYLSTSGETNGTSI